MKRSDRSNWPVYENGFCYGGLGAMDDIEGSRSACAASSSALIEYDHGSGATRRDRYGSIAWAMRMATTLAPGTIYRKDATSEWCVMPAGEFVAWGLYQPTQRHIIDFANANGHIDPGNEMNGAFHDTYTGFEDGRDTGYERTGNLFVEDINDDEVVTDVGCSFRTSVRNAGFTPRASF